MKILRLLTSFALLFMISSCSTPKNPDQIALERIDSLMTLLFPAGDPGAAALVLKGDATVFNKGYGLANTQTQAPIDGKTFFNIASVSKQFSGVGLMVLQEDGKLLLDDNLQKFFPHFKAPFFKEITLRHLLAHTSGIPDSRPRHDRHFVLTATDEASYAYIEHLKELNFTPGTAYEYMNPTYQLMYTIIEQCSGQSYDDFMRERIFLPAGMNETTFFEEGKEIPRMAHGYRPNKEGGFSKNDYGEASFFATKADGGLYTSTEEFVLWEKALRDNILIPAHVKEEAHSAKIEISDMPYTGYGYGWFIEEKPGFPKKVYHTGNNGGFQTYAGRYPEQQILMLIFATRDDWNREETVEKIDQMMKDAGWLN
jgi:CubicO group peptidase (beta-lactamase class C family)